MKRGIIIIVTLIVLSLVVFFAFNYVKSKNLISKEKVINNIVFKKAKITKKAGKYNFSVTIKCKGKENAVIESFDAIILDKKGNKIDVLSGYVGGINKGEIKIIEIKSDKDLSNAYEINYTVYNE